MGMNAQGRQTVADSNDNRQDYLSKPLLQHKLRNITRNYAGRITHKIDCGISGPDDYPQQFICNPKVVTESPQLKEFNDKCKYEDNRRDNKPANLFVWNNGPDNSVEQDNNQDITKITPYPAMGKKTDKDLDAEKH